MSLSGAAFRFFWKTWRAVGVRVRAAALLRLVPRCGKGVRAYGWPKIYYPENLTIGDRVSLNHGVFIDARGGVSIGEGTRLSPYAVLESGFLRREGSARPHASAPITIGRNVWIATGAIVLAGVTVGDHAIVAAGAVVTRDVPANALAKGVPARWTLGNEDLDETGPA